MLPPIWHMGKKRNKHPDGFRGFTSSMPAKGTQLSQRRRDGSIAVSGVQSHLVIV
jgi:hypothetical protein